MRTHLANRPTNKNKINKESKNLKTTHVKGVSFSDWLNVYINSIAPIKKKPLLSCH